MAERFENDEQVMEYMRRMGEQVQRLAESFRKMQAETFIRFREVLEAAVGDLVEEERHVLGQEVEGFAHEMDNLTTSRMWRELESYERRSRGEDSKRL